MGTPETGLLRSVIRRVKTKEEVKNAHPTDDPFLELCKMDIIENQDSKMNKKYSIRHYSKRTEGEDLRIWPTVEDNRKILEEASRIWEESPKTHVSRLPNWSYILERPLFEQYYLMRDYIEKVSYDVHESNLSKGNVAPATERLKRQIQDEMKVFEREKRKHLFEEHGKFFCRKTPLRNEQLKSTCIYISDDEHENEPDNKRKKSVNPKCSRCKYVNSEQRFINRTYQHKKME